MRALRHHGFLLLLALLAACGNDAAPLKGGAAVYTEVIQEVYIANFGRAADTAGLESFAGQLAGMGAAADMPNLNASYVGSEKVRGLFDNFGASEESRALYGSSSAFVTAVYTNLTNRPPPPDRLAFWVDALDRGGLKRGGAALGILAAIQADSTPQGQADVKLIEKKVALSNRFAVALDTPDKVATYSGDAAAATVRAMLAKVNDSTGSGDFRGLIDATLAELKSKKL